MICAHATLLIIQYNTMTQSLLRVQCGQTNAREYLVMKFNRF